MPNSSTYSVVGWTLSLLIYCAILVGAIFTLQSHIQKNIKYTASKKNLLNVTLVERKVKKQITKKKQKVVKKKITVNKPKPQKETTRAKKTENKPKLDLSKLFKTVDIDKIPDPAKKREKKVRKKIVKKEIEEIIKTNDAKKITKSLEFEKQESLIITQKDGIYDKFRGKITDTLDMNWQKTINTISGNEAEVIVGIDKLGSFSYKIETLSYNDAFNAKLRDFLEEMKDVEFPAFKDGEIFYMKTKFKDILE